MELDPVMASLEPVLIVKLLLLLMLLLALEAVRVGVIELGSTVGAGVRLVVVRLLRLTISWVGWASVARTRQSIFYGGLRLVGLEQPH